MLYDRQGERVQTVRSGRMPESQKLTLQQPWEAEAASLLVVRPDWRRVYWADGAKDNWRWLGEREQPLGPAPQPGVEIVDFYHACHHLKNACDAAWGESTPRGQAEFERLKTLLTEAESGANQVMRLLKYQRGRARGHQRERLEADLSDFRHQRPRMDYAEYLRQGLPIASGVIEATCKTLVTQRMKRSGMAWTQAGGQAILTLRSLIQSARWSAAWQLLSADFRKIVARRETPKTPTATLDWESLDAHPMVTSRNRTELGRLPLAA